MPSDEERGPNKYVDPEAVPLVVHPNVLLAYLNYNGDPEQFKQNMREGKNGHDDSYDEYMKEIAADRTIAQALLGWRFKKSKRRK